MKKISFVVLSASMVMLSACSSSQPADKAAIEKSVRGIEGNMSKALNAKDAAAFSSNYAADAILMTPGEAAMKGPDAIRSGMATMLGDPNFKIDFSADRVEVADSGDLAVTHGKYMLTATDPATKKLMNDKGSYVTVYRKQTDGAWKAILDINTSEVPPPAPPAPKAKTAVKAKRKKR